MSDVGQIERKTQDRIVGLFRDSLGFDYLGNWGYREGSSNGVNEVNRARGWLRCLMITVGSGW